MRTGQGYAEFAVFSFGAERRSVTRTHRLASGTIPPKAAHLGGAAQHHRRTAAGAAPRPVVLHAKIHAGLTTVRPAWILLLGGAGEPMPIERRG